MSDDHDLITRLDAHLQVALSASALREARAVARKAERAGRRPGARRRGLVALIVAGGLALGGGAVAYAAPQTWMWLFPPAVTKSYTFQNGETCTVMIVVRAEYSGGNSPTPADMSWVQDAATRLDVASLDVPAHLPEAEATYGDDEAETPGLVERMALGDAVYDEMVHLTHGPRNGASWSMELSCD